MVKLTDGGGNLSIASDFNGLSGDGCGASFDRGAVDKGQIIADSEAKGF